MNRWWILGLALPAILGIAWITLTSPVQEKPNDRMIPTKTPPENVVSASSSDASPAAMPSPTTTAASSAMVWPKSIDSVAKTQIISTKALQELLDKDPSAALLAARESLLQSPDDPDAAERTWVVVKSLASLGRFPEARREAEVMVPKFRGTRWADDVERHVLAHP